MPNRLFDRSIPKLSRSIPKIIQISNLKSPCCFQIQIKIEFELREIREWEQLELSSLSWRSEDLMERTGNRREGRVWTSILEAGLPLPAAAERVSVRRRTSEARATSPTTVALTEGAKSNSIWKFSPYLGHREKRMGEMERRVMRISLLGASVLWDLTT